MLKTGFIRIGSARFYLLFLLLNPGICYGSEEIKSQNQVFPDETRVLILHSYNFGFSWTDNISTGINEYLAAYKNDIEIIYEFIDARRISSDEYLGKLEDLFHLKYSDREINVIICADDHALSFITERDIFPGVPAVFCSATGYNESMKEHRPMTGLIEDLAIGETLEQALIQNPDTRRVTVISDFTKTGMALRSRAEPILRKFESRVSFNYIDNLTIDELTSYVSKLPQDEIIFLFIFSKDKQGRVFSHERNLSILKEYSSVPIYAVWDFYLGHGIVGGKLSSGKEEGRMAAEMAVSILKGKDISDIPLRKSPSLFMYDYNQLKKWGIRESLLPENSQLINEPVSVYQQFRIQIWFISVIALILIAFIIFLINLNVRRKRVEIQLVKSNEQLQSTTEALKELNAELEMALEEANRSKELEEALNKLKAAQAQLIQSEKMASVGTLTAGIAHEINNPLNFIHGGIYALEKYMQSHFPDSGEVLNPLINSVKTGVERTREIVSSLNRFNRKSDTLEEQIDIHKVIDDCLVILQGQLKYKVEVNKEFTTDEYRMKGNEGQLHQVFLNIISNAEQAIEEQGIIGIRTEVRDEKMLIKIVDNGIGISRENLPRISDPFFTTKDPGKGTGLGLSIAFSIVRNHNGRIEFESKEGEGTIVKVYLPVIR